MIRRAEKKDIGRLNDMLLQVQRLHALGRPDIFKLKPGAKKYTSEELTAILEDDNTPVFVYEEDGVVMGYAFCIYQVTEESDNLCGRKVLYLDDLCVDEPYRGRHIGKKLYEYVLDTARENGCDSVTLNVWRVNPSAEKFYQSMGMQPLKTMMEQTLGTKK